MKQEQLEERKDALVGSEILISIVPEDGYHEGELGLEDIAVAIAEKKQIFLWRPDGRRDVALPEIVTGYQWLKVVDGSADQLMDEVKRHNSGVWFELADGGY